MTKMRHLSRDSAHRRALLRNMATSLIQYEFIQTTWPKAKEAQRWVEKLITLGKKNTIASRNSAMAMIFDEQKHMPKIFGELATRYANRPGGYTRVLRTESHMSDAADSAILSLVDGPRDMKFAMTAKAMARSEAAGEQPDSATILDMHKVTRFRENGEEALEQEIKRLQKAEEDEKAELQAAYKEDGSQFHWIRAHKKAGPGELRKRRVPTGEPGQDPLSLLARVGKHRKNMNAL